MNVLTKLSGVMLAAGVLAWAPSAVAQHFWCPDPEGVDFDFSTLCNWHVVTDDLGREEFVQSQCPADPGDNVCADNGDPGNGDSVVFMTTEDCTVDVEACVAGFVVNGGDFELTVDEDLRSNNVRMKNSGSVIIDGTAERVFSTDKLFHKGGGVITVSTVTLRTPKDSCN